MQNFLFLNLKSFYFALQANLPIYKPYYNFLTFLKLNLSTIPVESAFCLNYEISF